MLKLLCHALLVALTFQTLRLIPEARAAEPSFSMNSPRVYSAPLGAFALQIGRPVFQSLGDNASMPIDFQLTALEVYIDLIEWQKERLANQQKLLPFDLEKFKSLAGNINDPKLKKGKRLQVDLVFMQPYVKDEPKDAKNYYPEKRIEIYSTAWARLRANPIEKKGLVLHEILGVMGVELDEYTVSREYVLFLRKRLAPDPSIPAMDPSMELTSIPVNTRITLKKTIEVGMPYCNSLAFAQGQQVKSYDVEGLGGYHCYLEPDQDLCTNTHTLGEGLQFIVFGSRAYPNPTQTPVSSVEIYTFSMALQRRINFSCTMMWNAQSSALKLRHLQTSFGEFFSVEN